jgi:hypothetical protein
MADQLPPTYYLKPREAQHLNSSPFWGRRPDSRRLPSGQVGASSQQPLVFGWAAHFALTCLVASSS